jgi:hypothetical protein
MRTIVGILGAFVLALAATQAQENTAGKLDDATQKLLISNEHSLYEAVANADKASFQSLVVPEGVWTTTSGFVPLGLLANGLEHFQLPKWSVENPRVTWTDGNSAMLLYTRRGGGTFSGQQSAETTLASTLWTKRDGKWLAVHHQETALTQQ